MDTRSFIKVVLRPVDLISDLPMVIKGIRNFVSRMNYIDFLPDSDDELASALQRLLDLGCVEILVADHEGRLVGGIGLLYAPCIWNPAMTVMEELFLWAAEDAPVVTVLCLLRYARQQARLRDCQLMTFKSLTSSPASLDGVYRRMGLTPIETTYIGPC